MIIIVIFSFSFEPETKEIYLWLHLLIENSLNGLLSTEFFLRGLFVYIGHKWIEIWRHPRKISGINSPKSSENPE